MSDFEDGFRELPGGELEVELRGRRFVLTPEHPAMGPRHPEWQRFREATDGDPWMRAANDELELEG